MKNQSNVMIEIYYFSGTGNSLRIAEGIAESIKGKIIPIASLESKDKILSQSEKIGIIFPVYYADLPMIVKRFTDKLNNIEGKYVFAVATYGGDFGNSFKTLSKVLEKRNGKLSAKFGIHMPQNAFKKPWENIDSVIKKANKKVELICEKIENRYEGYMLGSKIMNLILTPFYIVIKSLYKDGIAKISGSDKNLEIKELINRADIGFEVKDNCISCGMCQKVCAVNNIKLENGKPVWLHKCENCLACFNLCPQEAIETKIVSKNYHYKFPGLTPEEMIVE